MAIVGTKTVGERFFKITNAVLLFGLSVLVIYPLFNIIAISLSSVDAVNLGEVSILPIGLNVRAYEMVFSSNTIFRSYLNTIAVMVPGTVLGVLATAFMAYALSKKALPGVVVLNFLIAFTLWFDPGMIPRFLVVRYIGLYDKLLALILVNLTNAYYVFVMKSFFENLPSSIEESALLDGCTEVGILFRIVLPVSKPVLATIALWIAVFHWNSFLEPLIYLKTRVLYTLQIVLRDIVLLSQIQDYGVSSNEIQLSHGIAQISVSYAAMVLSILPILAIYPFVQKYFVKGVMIGAVKG